MVPKEKKKKKSVKHANANVPVRTTQRTASMTRPSAIFMQGDGDRLISPSSCSQVLEMRLSHTPKIVRWTAWKPVITRTEFINSKTGTEKTKFLIQGFSEAATKEVLGWFFFLSPLLLWEFKAQSWPLQRPLSHLLKIKPLRPALRIRTWEPELLAQDAVPVS